MCDPVMSAKKSLPLRNYARKALLLDRPSEPLCVRVAVRSSERRLNDPNSLLLEELQHATTPFSIAIADQNATISQGTVTRIRQAAYALQHKGLVGKRSGARHVDTPRLQFEDEDCVVRH